MSKTLPKLGWLVIILVVVAVAVGSWLGLRIRHIKCSINAQPCDSTELANFNFLYGQPIFFFNQAKLVTSLSSDSPLKLEKVNFRLPNTIELTLSQQTAAYQVASDGQAQVLTISSAGLVMPSTSQTQLTTIYVSADILSRLQTQTVMDAQFHQQIIDLLATLATNNQASPILTWVDNETLALDTPNQPQIILDPSNLRTDLARLKITQQALQSQPSISQVAEIDVRYQLPVLRTTPSIPRHQPQ